MKINVEIDCTPEEARQFLGLPDLRPMQDAVMARIQQQMLAGVDALAPEALLKAWMPLAPQTPDQLRDAMGGLFRMFNPLATPGPGTPPGQGPKGPGSRGSGQG
ncbi:DUF6489 family protein [Paeniroseomonas aquatica]|uniref:DUF6489 family protein n=1 Tax=Paeniroseomonas aquatica TaxID=373043 RepID=A0ABT8A350_9PROT|nr:DUF6489 family protein [Paeniroseomonas aquatica]MDN3564093.1 DUF6489 family protein [Paeniroseomonas aquatica]